MSNTPVMAPQRGTCPTCYWFRYYDDHVVTLKEDGSTVKYPRNRGCTYGWEKRIKVEDGKPGMKTTRIEVEGDDCITIHECDKWRDCGLLAQSLMKSIV